MKKPDTAELELADFIRRTNEALDEHGRLQLAAALRYLQGREKALGFDKDSVLRHDRLYDFFRNQE